MSRKISDAKNEFELEQMLNVPRFRTVKFRFDEVELIITYTTISLFMVAFSTLA